jgi:hypothetical protein
MFSARVTSGSTVHHEYEWGNTNASKSKRNCRRDLQSLESHTHDTTCSLRQGAPAQSDPVGVAPGKLITISPGEHSELIRAIIEDFAPRFAPGSVLVYAGDTGEKWGYFDKPLLTDLGVEVDAHGKMPDVVLHYTDKNWLLLIESVTSHGPVDGKRHAELAELFAGSRSGLVYVTAFPNRAIMGRYLGEIAWETEVWVADAPSHLIHFNGERFLGPYPVE